MRSGLINVFLRTFSISANNIHPQICIVGAGPAGYYTAQQLIKHLPLAQIDMYERLPVPFGLVRFGVAPDHPEVKNVMNTYSKTAEHKNVRFLGNVTLGVDISLADLHNAYHSVLLTYGADENRTLDIPGEKATNVFSARQIVGWYNGTPWDRDLKVDLSGETAIIIGQGNVAMDVARILLTPIDDLKRTDITQYALDTLAESAIKRVHVIGRRGPLQAAFTIKEFREMLKLNGVQTILSKEDFIGIEEIVSQLPRPKKRIATLMLNAMSERKEQCDKEFIVNFCQSPLDFQLNGASTNVGGITLAANVLRGRDYASQVAVTTLQQQQIACQLAVTSIGYKSVQAEPSIPFDARRGIVPNDKFKVSDNLYVSGWLATGPTGVILTTMTNAFATAETMIKDLQTMQPLPAKPGFEFIGKILRNKNVQVVEWSDWLKIDAYERAEGKIREKPREKIVDITQMLQVAE